MKETRAIEGMDGGCIVVIRSTDEPMTPRPQVRIVQTLSSSDEG